MSEVRRAAELEGLSRWVFVMGDCGFGGCMYRVVKLSGSYPRGCRESWRG